VPPTSGVLRCAADQRPSRPAVPVPPRPDLVLRPPRLAPWPRCDRTTEPTAAPVHESRL